MSIREITIIITSFKSKEKIKNCLNSINKQCKVIVVENSNDSDFKKNIENEFSNVECILTGENLGYGKANNIGLKKVVTRYALILNPDALLHSSALENFFRVAKKYSDFAIMAPHTQEKSFSNKDTNEDKFTPISVQNVKGFAMFLNLSEFKEVGFFDEKFFLYFEEIDLCKRLINLGKKIYLVPAIIIEHVGGQSHDVSINKSMELSRNWHWMWSTFYYQKKYKGFIISFLFALPKLFSSVLKMLFYILIFNKEKKEVYYYRYLGLINAMMGKSSWYRPQV